MLLTRIIIKLASMGLFPLSDRRYIELQWKRKFGKKINWEQPQSFNEKLQWLKINDRRPYYTEIVDKIKAKEIISKMWGEQYLVPTLGIWNSVEEIEYEKLPNKFVLKCTHDSGSTVICSNRDNFDINALNVTFKKLLKKSYYIKGREWPYKDVPRKIIAESFLGEDIEDYKLMCFNGKVKCSFVCSERRSTGGLKVTFYDKNWKKIPFERHYPASEMKIPMPKNYKKMVELAEKAARGIPFVRVDFYEVNGKLYFGELTLYPGNGFEEFTPEEWDDILGQWIDLKEIP